MATATATGMATGRGAADRRTRWLRRTFIRAATIAMIAAAIVESPAVPASAGPASGPIVLDVSHGARGSTITVTTTGCNEPDQLVEARLVVGGFFKHSVAVALAARPWGSSPATTTLTVPEWAQSGPAAVEASCLVREPESRRSDGTPDLAFDYESASYRIDSGRPSRAPRVQMPVVTDGILRVSGNGCGGTVTVEVARGLRLIATHADFHFASTASGHGDSQGRWTAEHELRYASGEYRTNLAPGPMTAFSSCDGVALPTAFFWISSRSPAPELIVGWSPTETGFHLNLLMMRCADGNTIKVQAAVKNNDGTSTTVGGSAPGRERYGAEVNLELPAGTVSASIAARCQGWRGMNWSYAPVIWTPASHQP